MKTWNERLREELRDSIYNKRSFAEVVGVSAPTVTDWTNGTIKEISGVNLERVCSLLLLNPKWLLTGQGPKSPGSSVEEAPANYVAVSFKDIQVRPGENALTYEIHLRNDKSNPPLYYRSEWLKENFYRLHSLFARKVKGSSMEPALFEGDKVLINMDSKDPANGKVFAVIVDKEPIIKRIRKRGSEWWITSDNPAHANTDLPMENRDQIIGEVIEKISTNI